MRLHFLLRRHKLTVLVLVVAAVVMSVYWQTFSRIVDMWSFQDYQHGWFVCPLSLYVLMKKRDALALTPWRTSKRGVLLASLMVLVWVAARATGIQVVEFVSATSLIFASCWAIAGTDAIRKAAFPLLLLLAAVPMGAFLVEPLMKVTAEIASALLTLAGIPTLRDGQFFFLPGGSFEVADVCSGLQYLIAGTLVSLGYAYVTYSGNGKRILFVGIAAIVLVIANGVRAFIVMSVASATDMKILGGRDHVIFGMFLFAVVLVAMIWTGEGYADPKSENKQLDMGQRSDQVGTVSGLLVTLTLITLVAGPVFSAAIAIRGAVAIVDLPLPGLDCCLDIDDWTSEGSPAFPTADYQNQGLFACGDYEVGVYVASYGKQQQGKELIGWGNRVWPNEWRRYVDRSIVSIQTSDGAANVQQVLVRHPAGWRLIWYWYQVGPSVTSSQNRVKLLETLRALTLQPVESSIVVVSVISSSENNEAELREQLERRADRVMSWNRERVDMGRHQ